MCIFICFNKFKGAEEAVNTVQDMIDGSIFRRARCQLLSKFSTTREISPPPYPDGPYVQNVPRYATFKRPDSLTLPMYAGYRKHVGAQIVEGTGPNKHQV